MVPFVKGDPEHDFWKQNPELKIMSPFDELVKKKNGSKIMWAIYLWKDPKSPWNRIGVEDRKLEIEENYLGSKIDLEDYSFYANEYERKCLSIREQAYSSQAEGILEFKEYYDGISWADNSDKKIDLLKARQQLLKLLEEVEEAASEEYQYNVEGGRTESILETGEI